VLRVVVVPSPTPPAMLLPQHHRLPSVRVAQAVSRPALMLFQVVPATWTGEIWKLPGTPSWP
jgi:hypothetical protein